MTMSPGGLFPIMSDALSGIDLKSQRASVVMDGVMFCCCDTVDFYQPFS